MKMRMRYKIGTWNLNIFFSISLGLHLLFFTTVALLFPDFKIDRLPPLNIEVSLLQIVAQEKSVSIPMPAVQAKTQPRREEKKPQSPFLLQPEVKVAPLSDPSLEDGKSEIRNQEEERVEREPLVQVVSISLTSQSDKNSESLDPPPPNPSSLGEQSKVSKYPSFSDGEIIFAQPKYAENPKPLYPQEARKRGYQGEVVLKVEILSNGRVGQVEVKRSSGHEILDRSAFAAVKEWRFVPAKKGENPIPFWVNIPIKFRLQ